MVIPVSPDSARRPLVRSPYRRGRTDGEPMERSPDSLLSLQEAAALLGVHRLVVGRLAREGRLPGMRIGKLWRFRLDDVERHRDHQVDDGVGGSR